MKIKYTAPCLDYSGYGEAGRHDVIALLSVGVDVSIELTRHCLELADFGELGQLIESLSGKESKGSKIKILHTTPNIYGKFIEPGKYHIGRVFWETSKLPKDFARGCMMVDEIWTGSKYNEQAIRNSGVPESIPIKIIPEVINPLVVESFQCEQIEDKYSFYSIFEWTERKNPTALLEAYFREFEGQDDVILVIKTYVDNFSADKKREIFEAIKKVKKKLGLKSYPEVKLLLRLLDRDQIYRFHKTFDCFVSAHRGEGWGIPQMEALSQAKPVISTNCGGIHEHISDVAKLVNYTTVPLSQNSRNQQWYTNDQNWADIDLGALRVAMRWAYENQEEAKRMGHAGKLAVEDRFSPKRVGQMMLDRLEEIEKTL